jgi:plastocyanin
MAQRLTLRLFILPLGLFALALALTGCQTLTQYGQTTNTNSDVTTDDAMMAKTVTVDLAAQNDSDQSGTATLTEEAGKTKVSVVLDQAPANANQPAHIHAGACPNPGAVVYPLTNVVAGRSETTLDVSLEDLLGQLPLAINIHKSAAEIGTYVSCGDINGDAMMPAENGAVSGGEDDAAMVKDESDDAMMEEKSDDSMMEDKDDAMIEDTSTQTPPTQPDPSAPATVKTFNISGRNFAFSQSEIRVKEGDRVKIVFTNTDGFHDWTIDDFNAKTKQIQTGQTAEVEFVADQAGSFQYYCSVGQHRQLGMVGTLIVE